MNDVPTWVDIGPVAEVSKLRKVVVEHDGQQILVLAHGGEFYAFQNLCIHRKRELARGVVLNGRLVCPGHQWAFDLNTGWESIKQECQPTYPVRVESGMVQVDASNRSILRPTSPAHGD